MDAISLIFGLCADGNCLLAVLLLACMVAAVLWAGGCWSVRGVGERLAGAISPAVAWVRPGRLAGWCLLEDDICRKVGVVLGKHARGPPDRRPSGELAGGLAAKLRRWPLAAPREAIRPDTAGKTLRVGLPSAHGLARASLD
jgi:hypothetical protein